MTRRSPWGVLALIALSAGAYAIAWFCQTRREMNRLGARIPSPWLLALPIAAWYWLWCWAEGVHHVTAGRTTAPAAFLLALLGPFGIAGLQAELNALGRA
ncbi:MAG TPA: hypothetical protein VLX92_35255 [Kofleriaceae bacterium]|nr:hypothetical protein [Kofleriaceae bacterium]